MKYFITGGTGFIGGELIRQLRADQHEVVALVRRPGKKSALLEALGVQIQPGALSDPESLRRGMRGSDGVFHLAAWYEVGVPDLSPAHTVNVDGSRNVFEAMLQEGIERGVYTSTVGVHSDTHGVIVDESHRPAGPWVTHYERTKWQAHYEVAEPMMQQGLPLVIVQPGLVYGPGDRGPTHDFLVDYLHGRLRVVPKNTSFCWGYVEDIAAAHRLAMWHGNTGETYVTAGPNHTMLEAVRLLDDITGRHTRLIQPGPRLVKCLAACMSWVERVRSLPTMYASETLYSIAGVTRTASSRKAERELGFKARSLREGFQQTLAHEDESRE